MNTFGSALRQIIFAGVTFAMATAGALAQTSQVVPNALQGFSPSGDKPVQIKAQTFEVRDKENVAVFSGNVRVVQGDTTIRCKSLIVSYMSDSKAEGGARAAQPGPGGKSSISKLEALGGIVVTQKDQTATGDSGIYDMRTRIVTLVGNVVVSQGGNVMRGERMVVDLNSGVSRVESGKSRGQVEMLIPQSGQNAAKPGALGPTGPVPAGPKLDPLRPAQQN